MGKQPGGEQLEPFAVHFGQKHRWPDDAGVYDDRIKRPEAADGVGEDALDISFYGNVTLQRDRLLTEALDGGHRARCSFAIGRKVYCDRPTALRRKLGGCEPDTPGSACDEDVWHPLQLAARPRDVSARRR